MSGVRPIGFLLIIVCLALELSYPQQPEKTCAVTEEDFPFSFPACAMQQQHETQFVPLKFLRGADFNRYGLTWVRVVPGGYMYVNRKGRVIVRDISSMDNGADYFNHGMVRLERAGKYGYADFKGRIIVPIRYDGALNAANGRPLVCVGCKAKTTGEYSWFEGGHWFVVDPEGKLHSTPSPQR